MIEKVAKSPSRTRADVLGISSNNEQLNNDCFSSEAISIIIVFAAFLFINLATSSRLPTVYMDEVMQTDPAVNLYFGNGFTSSAWYTQTKDTFWAGQGLLYPILLYFWLLLFGFGQLAVRSLNYVLMIGSGLMLWLAVIRLNLVTLAWSRVALIALLLTSYGITFSYRTGRLDCTAIMLLAASVFAYSIQSTRTRCLLLLCIGVLFPMAGPQMVAYATIFCTLLLIYLGKSFLREAGSLAIGSVAGITLLYTVYSLNGVVDNFIASIVSHSAISKGVLSKFSPRKFSDYISIGFPFILAKDISFPFVLASALTLTVDKIRKVKFRLCSPLSFGLAVAFCVPLIMFILVHYPAYYSWMAFIPLAICAFSEISNIDSNGWNHLPIRISIGFLFVAGLVGLPLHLGLAAYDWNDRAYAPVEGLVERHVAKNDWVYCDFGAYYAAKKRAAVVILPPYLSVISSHEKERISVLIINPGGLESVVRTLGGRWYDTSESIGPEVEGLFGFPIRVGLLTLPKYKLRVFRREK